MDGSRHQTATWMKRKEVSPKEPPERHFTTKMESLISTVFSPQSTLSLYLEQFGAHLCLTISKSLCFGVSGMGNGVRMCTGREMGFLWRLQCVTKNAIALLVR